MQSRERVQRTLEHKETDKIPLDLGSPTTSIHRMAHNNLKNYLGFKGGADRIISLMQQVVKPDERILRYFDIDFRHVSARPSEPWQEVENGLFRDEWGIVYKQYSNYFEIVRHPFAEFDEVSELDCFQWPDPLDHRRFVGLEEEVKELYDTTTFAITFGGFSETFFGLPSWLMGHENFLTQLIINQDFIKTLYDYLEDFFLKLAREALKKVGLRVQVVRVADDLGMQSGPIVSPELYRTLIKPRHKRFFHYIKELTDAKLFYHSCGSIYPLINDLIECGIDALNPIQVSAKNMEPKKLKLEFGDRLAFWGGGCDTQYILPFGSIQDVKKETKKRIEELSPGGGYIFCAVHNIQYDVPPENIVAMYRTAKSGVT